MHAPRLSTFLQSLTLRKLRVAPCRGLELNPLTLFKDAKQTLVISATGIIFPFVLGSLGSIVLYRNRVADPNHPVPFPSFLLFTSLSLSITAFPVLAR